MLSHSALSEFPISGPGEGGGGGGDTGLSGELTLPALTTAGYTGAQGVFVLPLLMVSGIVAATPTLYGVVYLPEFEIEGFTGGEAEIELPMLEVSGAGTVAAILRGSLTLPALAASGTGLTGAVMRGSFRLPMLQTFSVPEFSSSGNWGVPGQQGLYLPMLEVTGSGYENVTVDGSIELPGLAITATATAGGAPNIAYIVLPALQTATGMSGELTLPMLRAAGSSTTGGATYRTWVMNLKTAAVTEFDNFAFRAMGFAYGRYWGIGMETGLWLLGGDTDNNDPIEWEWLSGLNDFGMVTEKGLLAVYLDGVFGRGIDIIVLTDDAMRVYEHKPAGDPTNHKPQRVTTGKGVRSRNLGFGQRSLVGAYLELDTMTPEYIVTKRRM